jgi:anti-anti-sigma factor
MTVNETKLEGVPIITIEGELDQAAKKAVLEVVGEMLNGAYPPPTLLFDLTGCTFVDSGGISVLLTALGRVPEDGWLGIIGASAGPNRVLQYTGFLEHEKVRFFPSIEDAEWALARESIKRGSRGKKPGRPHGRARDEA